MFTLHGHTDAEKSIPVRRHSKVSDIKQIMDLVLPFDDAVRPLAFYLAQEEWLARRFSDRDFFFIWQVEPTVIIGRNQLLEAEVNVPFCKENDIMLVRRRSGGGAVLADMNNIMFSYITSSDSVQTTFSDYTSMVARSLRMLGLDARDNARNDVLIGDRKVSGNSYYHLSGRSIVHGTMLYDYDEYKMAHALTPPQSKLRSHGVASVRSRITTIREHLPELTIADFKSHVLATIPAGGEILKLGPQDIREIEKIEQGYYDPSWLNGRNPRGSIMRQERIDGVGTLTVHVELKHGLISEATLTGDYLETGDASALVKDALKGVAYERDAVDHALCDMRLEELIPGLSPSALTEIIV